MKAWDDYWFGPVVAARPYLLLRAFLLLLGFDCFVELIGHGGRYGIGDFNVAHFAWLDALQPVPSSGLYVGLLSLCGLLCFAIAFAGVNRWALGALAIFYTYGWMMSMLDSYQHHYLLSIVLIAFVFFPKVSGADLVPPKSAKKTGTKKTKKTKKTSTKTKRTSTKTKRRKSDAAKLAAEEAAPPSFVGPSWAYHLVCVSFTIVYAYTALSKSESQWRSGEALQRIAPGKLDFLREILVVDLGFAEDNFWGTMGLSVILLQIVISATYALAPLRDRGVPWIGYLSWIGFFAAASFHLMAELQLELQIGWFSWYMLIAACVMLLPGRAVHVVAEVVALPGRGIANFFGGALPEPGKRGPVGAVAAMAVAAGAVVALAMWGIDMPGSLEAGIVAAVALTAGAIWSTVTKRPALAMPWIGASLLGAILSWTSVASSEVRFDFYRKLGGVHRRHGNCELALDAYIKANEYAPAGEDRQDKEEEMRRCVERRREGAPSSFGHEGHDH